MIIVYIYKDGAVEKRELEAGKKIPKNTVWIDLIEPKPSEEKAIEKAMKVDMPTQEEMDKIEVKSPFYRLGNAYYMTATVLYRQDISYPDSTAVTFVITDSCLITLRYSRPRAFNNFNVLIRHNPGLAETPQTILEGLVESIVHRIADVLETVGNELDELLKEVFEKESKYEVSPENSSEYYDGIIKRIGRIGNLISKNRESLVSINRMLIFFSQMDNGKYMQKKEQRNKFKNLFREVHSLNEYVNFLSQRNSFLLDATLGMISVEQNKIIKVFTVAAAVFMPPTLIASIYGMNFAKMPELGWELGYPMAIVMMLISAILPYLYFKKKGWL
jgi:magnesium transporter